MGKTILITGASSGIGKATAKLLAAKNHTVFAGARRLDRMDDLKALGVHTLDLDVTDDDACRNAVETVMEAAGHLDVLINNAGYGVYAAIEDVTIAEAMAQYDVNVFGTARMIRQALPFMRQRGSGRVINVASIAGHIQAPLGGWYHSSKHALEGLTHCLRLEAEPFGVRVVLIEPGLIRTPFYAIAAQPLLNDSGEGPYGPSARSLAETFKKIEGVNTPMAGSHPEIVGKAILDAVEAAIPKTRYVVGKMARLTLFARSIMPDRMFDAVIRKAMTPRS